MYEVLFPRISCSCTVSGAEGAGPSGQSELSINPSGFMTTPKYRRYRGATKVQCFLGNTFAADIYYELCNWVCCVLFMRIIFQMGHTVEKTLHVSQLL